MHENDEHQGRENIGLSRVGETPSLPNPIKENKDVKQEERHNLCIEPQQYITFLRFQCLCVMAIVDLEKC